MPAGQSVAVLYVEDETLIRELVEAALRDDGFDVISAADGAAALDALEENVEPFRVLVTDVNLGAGPDGWDVAVRAREVNRALDVIYVTGESAHEWKTKGVPHSMMIVKPFNLVQIEAAIFSLLSKTQPSISA